MNQAQCAFWRRGNFAIDLVSTFGVITKRASRASRLGLPCHGDFSAVVSHTQHRQSCMVRLNLISNSGQYFLALGRGHARPYALLKTASSSCHCTVHVLRPGRSKAAQYLPVDGRDHWQRLPRSCRSPVTINQQTLIRNGLVAQAVNLFLIHLQFIGKLK